MDYLQIVNGGGVLASLFSLILKPALCTVLAGIMATILEDSLKEG